MKYQRGDVVWVRYPFTDLTEAKKRPALIISNNLVNSTGDYIMMMVTTKPKDDGLSVMISDDDYSESPLGLESSLRLHKVFTLNESLIDRKDTTVTKEFCDGVAESLASLLREERRSQYLDVLYGDY